jgi:putative flippase GtrA
MSVVAGQLPTERKAVPVRGFAKRLFSRNTAVLFVRNTLVSCLVFAFGLLLLWLLVESIGMNTLIAAAVAFLAATSLHFAFGYHWIYRGTERRLAPGYGYFLINAGIGFFVTMVLFAALLRWTPMNYLVARILVSVFAGLTMFLLNAVLNFKRV